MTPKVPSTAEAGSDVPAVEAFAIPGDGDALAPAEGLGAGDALGDGHGVALGPPLVGVGVGLAFSGSGVTAAPFGPQPLDVTVPGAAEVSTACDAMRRMKNSA